MVAQSAELSPIPSAVVVSLTSKEAQHIIIYADPVDLDVFGPTSESRRLFDARVPGDPLESQRLKPS